MLVSHETPVSFLETSRRYNDYDYALVHLFETNPEYYSFFKASKTLGREVLLDNSIFELGEAFDTKKFVKYVKELLVDCYTYMANMADYIAISFDYSWYDTITESSANVQTKYYTLEKQSKGRRRLIDMLQQDKIWDHNKPHHLLGCSLASEFKHYTWDKSIRSLDTSNPVVAGILNKRYYKGIGLLDKPSVLLADLITAELNDEQEKDILYNVEEFKNLLRS